MKCNVHVLLLAGGHGSRFGTNLPKQFVEVDGIPIIIYTLRKLQVEPVSSISVVCIEKWIPYLRSMIAQYGIEKVKQIIPGGPTGFISTLNGIKSMDSFLLDDDIVVIHDSVRPLLPKTVLDDAVDKAIRFGNGCASLKTTEGLVIKDDDCRGHLPADRYKIMRIQTPQAYQYGLLKQLLEKANQEGKVDFPYADGLCIHYGVPIYFSMSFAGNIKITTKPDVAFMKAMLEFTDDELLGEVL